MLRNMKMTAVTCLTLTCLPVSVGTQSLLSAGGGWTTSYSFPSAAERQVRLQYAEAQRRADSNGYGASQTTNYVTQNYNYDHSVGDTVISAAEGAYVQIENRTGENSGTNTNTVGSINTAHNEVTIEGDNNTLDLVNSSQSTGCQDGSINTSLNQLMDSVDISAAGASAGGAQATASSGVTTGGTPCQW